MRRPIVSRRLTIFASSWPAQGMPNKVSNQVQVLDIYLNYLPQVLDLPLLDKFKYLFFITCQVKSDRNVLGKLFVKFFLAFKI